MNFSRHIVTLIIVTTLFPATIAYSIDYYQIGDTLWTWAPSGLKLRAAPGIKAKVLDLLPFGTNVTVLENRHEHPGRDYSIQVVKGNDMENNEDDGIQEDGKGNLILWGYWIKVQVDEKTGYVFDGYLSRLQPCDIPQDNCSWGLDSCFLQHNKLIGHSLKEERDAVSYSRYEQFVFEGGIIVECSPTEKGWFAEYYLPGSYSLQEGFLIFDALFRLDRDMEFTINKTSGNYLEITYGICTLEIYCIAGNLLIIERCHC